MQRFEPAVEGLGMAVAHHLVATTRGRDRSLLWPERAAWLWTHLRTQLPAALSCVLMPDHLHLVAPPGDGACLRRVLTGFTVRFGVRFDVREPEVATTVAIAGRMIRYGYFNPVRAGLCRDPFEWPWSTLRDLVGACAPVWTPSSWMAEVLRLPRPRLLRGLTRLAGIAVPLPDPPGTLVASIEAVAQAVVSALRLVDGTAIRSTVARRLVVRASVAIGQPRVDDLASALGCTPRTIHRDRASRGTGLDAVLLCLADERLHRGPLDAADLGPRPPLTPAVAPPVPGRQIGQTRGGTPRGGLDLSARLTPRAERAGR